MFESYTPKLLVITCFGFLLAVGLFFAPDNAQATFGWFCEWALPGFSCSGLDSHRIPSSGYWCEGNNSTGYGYWTRYHWEFTREWNAGCGSDMLYCAESGVPGVEDIWNHAGSCSSGTERICSGDTFIQCQTIAPSCTNECSPGGSTRCLSGDTQQTCGDYNVDGCFEWGDDAVCPKGQECSVSSCQCFVPQASTLVGPSGTITKPFTFSWSQSPDHGDIVNYWVDVDDNANWDDGFWNYAVQGTSLSSSDFEDVNSFSFLPGQTYYWRVYAQTCIRPNIGQWSSTWSFTIASSPPPPPPPPPPSPPSGPTGLSASQVCEGDHPKVTFSWNSSSGADGYWVDTTTDGFANWSNKNTAGASAVWSQSLPFSGGLPITQWPRNNTNYEWRVYAYNASGGNHSATRILTTIDCAPAALTCPAPPPPLMPLGPTKYISTNNPGFFFTGNPDSPGYRIDVSEQQNFSWYWHRHFTTDGLKNWDNGNNWLASPGAPPVPSVLEWDKTYYWRVYAESPQLDCDGTYSATPYPWFRPKLNTPPVAACEVAPLTGDTATEFLFDASKSQDPDGDGLAYLWKFGDGQETITVEPTISHTYGTAGDYTASVLAGDGKGGGGKAQCQTVSVSEVTICEQLGKTECVFSTQYRECGNWNNGGNLEWSLPRDCPPNETCALSTGLCSLNSAPIVPPPPLGPTSGNTYTYYNFSVVTDDPQGEQIRYVIDWGDGTPNGQSGFLPPKEIYQMEHKWVNPGTYQIKVLACDERGLCSDWSQPAQIDLVRIFAASAKGWCSVEALTPYFGANAGIASQVCWAESGGVADIVACNAGHGCDVGLFQINTQSSGLSEETLKDPITNIQVAKNKSSGGTNWSGWSVAYKYTCFVSQYKSLLNIIHGCVKWHQCGEESASATSYNCWLCVSQTCP